MPNYVHRSHNFFLYIFIALFSFVLGWQSTTVGLIGNADTGDTAHRGNLISFDFGNDDAEENADLALFWTVWNELTDRYVDVDAIDPKEMVYGSIKGMVESLGDDYTVFMTPEESERFTASLDGTLEGIGAELTVEDQNLVIVSPLRDSPAEKAGLLPGDLIFKVDGELTAEMTLFDAIMHIRGEKGTTVVLTIIREKLSEPFDVSMVRDSIDLESVTVEKMDNGIVYLSINQFNDKTIEKFNQAISEMLLNEPSGLIIDLRYNGGGYLDIAVDMLSYLLPSNTEAVKIKQRNSADDTTMYTNGNPKLLNVPLVILVNEGSASASEIVAGAIQAHERGVVMGTQTFGKGTVQEVEMFLDGSSIRITIAKWFTPDNRNINEVGLDPDIIIEFSDEDIENEVDIQKDTAVDYLMRL